MVLLFVLLLGFVAGMWFLWRIPRLPGPGFRPEAIRLSVIIPARDEEKRLPALLASLKMQTVPPGEIILVDDHSSDRTSEIARAAGCTVILASPPPGWLGKPWACAAGAAAASGSHLLFLDADTWLEPAGLERLLAGLSENAQVVSAQPYHQVGRPYEQLSAFFNIIQMGGMGAFSPLTGQKKAGGLFGPCLLFTRAAYQAAGGHAAVRGEVLDDVRLGQCVRAAGLPAHLYGGQGVIAFRMYPNGLSQLVEGWSKNFSAGAAAISPAALLPLLAWIHGCLLGAGLPLIFWAQHAPAREVIFSVLFYTACAAQIWWMLRRLGSFSPLTAALYPIPLAFFVAVFLRSFLMTYLVGAVHWKGRTIRTRPPR